MAFNTIGICRKCGKETTLINVSCICEKCKQNIENIEKQKFLKQIRKNKTLKQRIERIEEILYSQSRENKIKFYYN